MNTLMALVLTVASWNADVGGLRAPGIRGEDGGSPSFQVKERIVIHKDGGLGHGPDQPYLVREQGAADLEGFVGGKYVVVEGPIDLIVLLLIVLIVVVIVIAL